MLNEHFNNRIHTLKMVKIKNQKMLTNLLEQAVMQNNNKKYLLKVSKILNTYCRISIP